jgi:hypothetical protein
MSTISSGTTLTTALVQVGDTTGNLVIKTGASNTTAMTISGTDQSVTLAGALTANGSSLTNINASSITSGVVALANGGTGANTAAAAFNALNPMTTTGDMLYEASPTTAARLAIGTTGQILTVAGGIPSWATVASSQWVTSGANISYTTGNVGIGTASPTTKLYVAGTGTQGITVERTDAATAGLFQLLSGNTTNVLSASTAKPIGFEINGTQRAQIDSSGNFYVGADTACNLTDFRTQSKAASGYQKLAGGVYIQWGSLTVTNNVQTTITFPIAFPSACTSVQFNCRSTDGSSIFFWDMRSLSASSTSVYTGRPSGGSSTLTLYYFAVGY